jgi:leader peptidase (prepilin peptidase) / N-methyltransferase
MYMFDRRVWAAVPFHFWSAAFLVFGCVVGSFLNVCIHRMPRGESIISPPSHCPHCGYHIPWYLNVPLVTWLYLHGRCAQCGAAITIRYFFVELITGLAGLSCWLMFGPSSPGVALAYCVLLAGFIVATFIDFEHFIIPDEITLGGVVVGFLASFLVPSLHQTTRAPIALQRSFWGIAVGGGIIYLILRLGKWAFGQHTLKLAAASRLVFTETALQLPDEEVPYEELFYRSSDAVLMQAASVIIADRQWENVAVRLTPDSLQIGPDQLKPEEVLRMEVVTDAVVLPREAMGLGDVKFMAAIGAFLGWEGVVFSLMLSSVLGASVGIIGILMRRKEWSSRIPYGPYIALAATAWIFGGHRLITWWLTRHGMPPT